MFCSTRAPKVSSKPGQHPQWLKGVMADSGIVNSPGRYPRYATLQDPGKPRLHTLDRDTFTATIHQPDDPRLQPQPFEEFSAGGGSSLARSQTIGTKVPKRNVKATLYPARGHHQNSGERFPALASLAQHLPPLRTFDGEYVPSVDGTPLPLQPQLQPEPFQWQFEDPSTRKRPRHFSVTGDRIGATERQEIQQRRAHATAKVQRSESVPRMALDGTFSKKPTWIDRLKGNLGFGPRIPNSPTFSDMDFVRKAYPEPSNRRAPVASSSAVLPMPLTMDVLVGRSKRSDVKEFAKQFVNALATSEPGEIRQLIDRLIKIRNGSYSGERLISRYSDILGQQTGPLDHSRLDDFLRYTYEAATQVY